MSIGIERVPTPPIELTKSSQREFDLGKIWTCWNIQLNDFERLNWVEIAWIINFDNGIGLIWLTMLTWSTMSNHGLDLGQTSSNE